MQRTSAHHVSQHSTHVLYNLCVFRDVTSEDSVTAPKLSWIVSASVRRSANQTSAPRKITGSSSLHMR